MDFINTFVDHFKLYARQLDTALAELDAIAPRYQNYDLEFIRGNIILHHYDGRVFSLESLLPEGYAFREGETFCCDHREKSVLYRHDHINTASFPLLLFHEIGHAQQGVIVPFSWWDIKKAQFSVFIHGYIPYWWIEKSVRCSAYSERDAWAYALTVLRRLEKSGFSVFNGLHPEEINGIVTGSLYTYSREDLLKTFPKLVDIISNAPHQLLIYKTPYVKKAWEYKDTVFLPTRICFGKTQE